MDADQLLQASIDKANGVPDPCRGNYGFLLDVMYASYDEALAARRALERAGRVMGLRVSAGYRRHPDGTCGLHFMAVDKHLGSLFLRRGHIPGCGCSRQGFVLGDIFRTADRDTRLVTSYTSVHVTARSSSSSRSRAEISWTSSAGVPGWSNARRR
jgi:hypothetical protein